MSWGPIVVGVDRSPEAAGAATIGYRIARAAAESCDLVHATPDTWTLFAAVRDPKELRQIQRLQLAVVRDRVTDALRGHVAPELLERLEVRAGPTARVLEDAARGRGAGLLVLGGKHHAALDRWLGGSTSLHVVRDAALPVLVVAGAPAAMRRVLVAADLSGAALPTIAVAERFAALVGAQVRVVSVFEPLPTIAGLPPIDTTGYDQLSEELLERDVWPRVTAQGAEKVVRHGTAVATLLGEAHDWEADVLVVGAHGKGWAQRFLLGSVTEQLLNRLPTSLLVVPANGAEAIHPEPCGVEVEAIPG
jgi:nucleotide-binding universal stress UspA family protein